MTDEYERKLKAEGAAQCANLAGRNSGLQQQVPEVAAPTLRERIGSQRYHAQVESRRLEQLHELEYLLEKHPEVARILELIEIVRA